MDTRTVTQNSAIIPLKMHDTTVGCQGLEAIGVVGLVEGVMVCVGLEVLVSVLAVGLLDGAF